MHCLYKDYTSLRSTYDLIRNFDELCYKIVDFKYGTDTFNIKLPTPDTKF